MLPGHDDSDWGRGRGAEQTGVSGSEQACKGTLFSHHLIMQEGALPHLFPIFAGVLPHTLSISTMSETDCCGASGQNLNLSARSFPSCCVATVRGAFSLNANIISSSWLWPAFLDVQTPCLLLPPTQRYHQPPRRAATRVAQRNLIPLVVVCAFVAFPNCFASRLRARAVVPLLSTMYVTATVWALCGACGRAYVACLPARRAALPDAAAPALFIPRSAHFLLNNWFSYMAYVNCCLPSAARVRGGCVTSRL